MLMQSPPMQAAGKSHSSMSVGDQRGGESQGLPPHTARGGPGSPQTPGVAHTPRPTLDEGTVSSWTWGLGSGGSGGGRNRPAPQL